MTDNRLYNDIKPCVLCRTKPTTYVKLPAGFLKLCRRCARMVAEAGLEQENELVEDGTVVEQQTANINVREMTDSRLINSVRGWFMDSGFIRMPDELDELGRRLSELRERIEVLADLATAPRTGRKEDGTMTNVQDMNDLELIDAHWSINVEQRHKATNELFRRLDSRRVRIAQLEERVAELEALCADASTEPAK